MTYSKFRNIILAGGASLSLAGHAQAVLIVGNADQSAQIPGQAAGTVFSLDPGTSGGTSMWAINSVTFRNMTGFVSSARLIVSGVGINSFQSNNTQIITSGSQDITFNFSGPEADRTLTAGAEYAFAIQTNGASYTFQRGGNVVVQGNNDAVLQTGSFSGVPWMTIDATPINPIPEPSGAFLLGLGALAGLARRRR